MARLSFESVRFTEVRSGCRIDSLGIEQGARVARVFSDVEVFVNIVSCCRMRAVER